MEISFNNAKTITKSESTAHPEANITMESVNERMMDDAIRYTTYACQDQNC